MKRPNHGFDRNASHNEDKYVCDCGYDNCQDADDVWMDWAEVEIERIAELEKALADPQRAKEVTHFVTQCVLCATTISQCRCPAPNKTQKKGLCKACTGSKWRERKPYDHRVIEVVGFDHSGKVLIQTLGTNRVTQARPDRFGKDYRKEP